MPARTNGRLPEYRRVNKMLQCCENDRKCRICSVEASCFDLREKRSGEPFLAQVEGERRKTRLSKGDGEGMCDVLGGKCYVLSAEQ